MVQALHYTVGTRPHTPACTTIGSIPTREPIAIRISIQTLVTITMGPPATSILTYLGLVAAQRRQPVPTVPSILVEEQTQVELRQVAASPRTIMDS